MTITSGALLQPSAQVKRYHVSEWFRSIQGEGLLAGTPSTFIRLAHCNLSCSWCDAAYTWKGKVSWDEMSLRELVDACEGTRHVVLTGGEPTIHDGITDLIEFLFPIGQHHVTVETNGTEWPVRVDPDNRVKLWSISPKLGSSGQRPRPRVLASYLQRYDPMRPNIQLKFVIDSESDLHEAVGLLHRLKVNSVPVLFQPNGLCHTAQVMINGQRALTDQGVRLAGTSKAMDFDVELQTPYLDRVRWLYELILHESEPGGSLARYNVRALTQAHKLAWGNQRGF